MKPMKQNKPLLVAVSALALNLVCGPVFGQVIISCPQTLNTGNHATCSNGNLVINPDGTTDLTGCLITTVNPIVGRCMISTGGAPAVTHNVRVDFTKSFINVKNGTKQMLLDQLMMQHTGVGAPATQFTFTPAEVSQTVTVDVGGRLNFNNSDAIGAYTGNISVRAVVL